MSDKQRKEEETSLEGRSSTAVLRLVGSARMHPTQKAVRPHYPHSQTSRQPPLKLTNLVFPATAVLEQVFPARFLIGTTPLAARQLPWPGSW